MKIWLPYVSTGGGADVSTEFLARTLREGGHDATTHSEPHKFQYAPFLLRRIEPPAGTQAMIVSSFCGMAFHRKGIPMIVVERLFTPHPEFRQYRSFAQSVFHEGLMRAYVSYSFAKAARVVAMSQATLKHIHAYFPKADPALIYNAVDLSFFQPPATRQPLEGRPFRLLFIGNLIRRKGADLLPPIMAQLGDGFELRYTSGLRVKDQLSDTPNSVPLGKLTIEQVIQQYHECDALLFPSRMEGLPRAVMEAQACGLPAVVSDASSLPESVHDGVSGTVCENDNVGAYVAAIRAMAASPERHREMCAGSRAWAEERFDLQRMRRQYEELLESVVQ